MSSLITFKKLSQTTSIYEPDTELSPQDANGNTPTAILIFGWMGGTTRSLTRYTTKYHSLFPSAPIILVTCPSIAGIQSLVPSASMTSRAQPSVTAILASGPNPNLLVHVFSNGGGLNLAAVASLYQLTTGHPLPAAMLVMDSMPGGDDFRTEWRRWVRAMAIGLPSNPLLFYPARLLIVLLVALLIGLPGLFGVENVATRARRDMNDPTLMRPRGKKVYLYSRADELIGWRDIEVHADEARRKGWEVDLLDFGSSGHVRHAIAEPERYWATVQRNWETGKLLMK